MATNAKALTHLGSGTTANGTDTDIITLTGYGSVSGGGYNAVKVQNTHATATLYVTVNGVTPTSTAGTGIVSIPATKEAVLPTETRGNGTVEVRILASAASTYNVIGLKYY
jgi:hypothetical protein